MTSARKISKKPAHIQRLVSAGNVGLIIALDKFDLKIKTRFLTYAAWWIRKEMFDEIHRSNIVHIPSHRQKAHHKAQRYGVYECVHCNVRIDNLQYLEETPIPSCTEIDHEFVLTDSDDAISRVSSLDGVVISDEQDIETETIDTDTSILLRKVLRKLPIRHRDLFIVLQYYNVAQEERRTEAKSLPQLSQITGITPERVRQIKEKVLREARKELSRRSVNDATDMCG
jgi:RNA polymerase primary sigma factor